MSSLGEEFNGLENVSTEAVFSPGPWPGFNGLVTLAVNDHNLYFLSPINGVVIRSTAIADIRNARKLARKTRLGFDRFYLYFRVGWRWSLFCSESEEGGQVIQRLFDRLEGFQCFG